MIKILIGAAVLTIGLAGYAVAQEAAPAPSAGAPATSTAPAAPTTTTTHHHRHHHHHHHHHMQPAQRMQPGEQPAWAAARARRGAAGHGRAGTAAAMTRGR